MNCLRQDGAKVHQDYKSSKKKHNAIRLDFVFLDKNRPYAQSSCFIPGWNMFGDDIR
jgi:hypothetical protein